MARRRRAISLALSLGIAAACGGSSSPTAEDDPPPPLPPLEGEEGDRDAEGDGESAREDAPAEGPPEGAVTYRMAEETMRSVAEAALEQGAQTEPVVPEEVRSVLPHGPRCDEPMPSRCAARGMELERAGRIEEAVDRYAAACREGLAIACGNLAYFLIIGDGIESDPRGAVPLLRYGCRAGQLTNCPRYGVRSAGDCEEEPTAPICSSGDWEPDGVEGLVTAACEDGAAIACSTRGAIAEERGRWDTAAEYYERGCEGDDGYGCHNLADMYMRKGDAVPVGPERAADLHRRACERDRFSSSCMKLATLRVNQGEPVREVASDFGRACEYGEEQVCRLLREVSAAGAD